MATRTGAMLAEAVSDAMMRLLRVNAAEEWRAAAEECSNGIFQRNDIAGTAGLFHALRVVVTSQATSGRLP